MKKQIIISTLCMLPVLYSCSAEYALPDNFMEEHFYNETRDLFFYNGVEALSRAVRLDIVDTVSNPANKEALYVYFFRGMSTFNDGNVLEIGSLNYDTGGKALYEDGAEWTVTNDYTDDFEYVMKYSGNNSWTVSFSAVMKVQGYDNDIAVEGEYLVRHLPSDDPMVQDYVIEYASGSYRDARDAADGVGIVEIRVDKPVNVTYFEYANRYTPLPFAVKGCSNPDIHMYKGGFYIVLTTLPGNELSGETYFFDMNESQRNILHAYVSYNGMWNELHYEYY